MTKSKHDLANVTISILVDFDKKLRFSISLLRSSQHYRWSILRYILSENMAIHLQIKFAIY